MKKHKGKIIVTVICGLMVIAGVVMYQMNKGTKPLKDLSMDDVESISMSMYLSSVTIELDEDEMERVVELLREIAVYEEDETYGEYNGMPITFWLKASDGSVRNINIGAPFVVIDGVGYRAKYDSCEALDQYANSLMSK